MMGEGNNYVFVYKSNLFLKKPGVSNSDTFNVPGSAGCAGVDPSIDNSPMSLFRSHSDASPPALDKLASSAVDVVTVTRSPVVGGSIGTFTGVVATEGTGDAVGDGVVAGTVAAVVATGD